jgi:adenylyltransferase/sulfurtransferase
MSGASLSSFASARVLVVGVGGLGTPAALALAAAGVGTLGLLDEDAVDLHNLHRQILFEERDVGAPKVQAAARSLARRFPCVRAVPIEGRLLPDNAAQRIAKWDVVVEGSDNFATKFLASDACLAAGVRVVQGSAIRWVGTAFAAGPAGRPCYRCLFEDAPDGEALGCDAAGVLGPVCGVIGAALADLALLALLETAGEGAVGGTVVSFDGRTGALRRRRVSARAGCASCGIRGGP